MKRAILEIIVGLFMIAGIVALAVLAFKVSGLSQYTSQDYYELTAYFDNIGDLKVRAPVTIAGVKVGEVAAVNLDPQTFRARVLLRIDKGQNNLPVDTTVNIYTQGLLGANYISLVPGFADEPLKDGGNLVNTHSALILENLIGQFLFNLKGSSDNS